MECQRIRKHLIGVKETLHFFKREEAPSSFRGIFKVMLENVFVTCIQRGRHAKIHAVS